MSIKTQGPRSPVVVFAPSGALTLTVALAAILAGPGCPQEKATIGPKACCEQPKIPAGVTPFVVVADEVTGPGDGEKIALRAGASQPIKRDQVYPVLQTLYVYLMKRGALEPIQIDASIYTSEAAARSGGAEGLAGRIVRGQSDVGPKCENKVPYDFPEQVARTFAATTGRPEEEDPNDTCHLAQKKAVARPDDAFTHKPSYKIDAAQQSVEVTYPYLDMGKDSYPKTLPFNSAMRDWIEYVTTFFRRVDGLKTLTFVGVLNDQPAVKITVSRAQFEGALGSLQEEVAAHSAITFASLGLHKKDDKGAAREQAAFQAKTYRAALARLPKNQVFVSPKLK